MITEGCSDAGTILDDFVVLHPNIKLLYFRDPEILQVLRRLFERCLGGFFPRGRAAADQTDDPINAHFRCLLLLVDTDLSGGFSTPYDGAMLFGMIAEGYSNAGTILDDSVVLHSEIELLDLSDPEILQMLCRFFESFFSGIFPGVRTGAH
jgi:hypothetical protein